MIKERFVQSPLNYTGGKYKLLSQLKPLFPNDIDYFIDVFGGGFNVGSNMDVNNIVYNELNSEVYKIVKGIYESKEDILEEIKEIINKFELSNKNSNGYLKLRDFYNNSSQKKWIYLFVLIMYSFNNIIRFNSKGEFNVPYGYRGLNDNLIKKLIDFKNLIQSKNIKFHNLDFEFIMEIYGMKNSFFYCDPLYLITNASYNDNNGWNVSNEIKLLYHLDKLNDKGCKFALSNVIKHKGKENVILREWSKNKKYKIHYLNFNYNNSSYYRKNIDKPTIEVLITNY